MVTATVVTATVIMAMRMGGGFHGAEDKLLGGHYK
jgi:hypothetical protein